MGAPKAPAVVQQVTQPTKDEKEAAKIAADQKKAALTKIRQDVFARSQGLRGAASMYDYAGRTPHLAGDPTGDWGAHPPAKPAAPKPAGWQDYTTIGGGHGPTIPGPQADRKVITGFNYGTGPRGDRDVGFTGQGGAPRNTDWVPPNKDRSKGPDPLFAKTTTMQGPKGDRSADPGKPGLTAGSLQMRFATDAAKKFGLPGPKAKPEINPLQFQQINPFTGKPMALQPALHPVGGPLPPRYATPPSPGIQAIQKAAGITPKAALYAPPALRAAAAKGDWQTINAMTGGSVKPTTSQPTPKATGGQPQAAAQTVRQQVTTAPAQTLGTPKATAVMPKPTTIFAPAPVAHPAAAQPKPIAPLPTPTLGGAVKPPAVLPTPAKLVAKPKVATSPVVSGRR